VLFENVLGAGGQALGAHVRVIGSSGTDPRLTAAWLRVTTVVERTLACLREDQRWEQQQRVQRNRCSSAIRTATTISMFFSIDLLGTINSVNIITIILRSVLISIYE
jgi:hypothetical protein